MRSNAVDVYLQRATALSIIPNFWLTREYLGVQDISAKTNGELIWIQEGEWALFPPLPVFGTIETEEIEQKCPPMKIWSDFENYSLGTRLEFLDWEYVYDSRSFFDLRGGRWKVFRKNARKWPRNNPNWAYSEIPPLEFYIRRLLVKWLSRRSDQEIADSESLLWFLLHGSRRAFIFRENEKNREWELIGINVWDANGKYLIYRYCIVDPDEPFLDEFMRLLFYRMHRNKLVIDGGVLDNPGLERFKDRLNPVKKRAIYSKQIN